MDSSSQHLPVYVINMNRSAERLTRFDRQARVAGLSYHRVEAIDGANCSGDTLFCFDDEAGRRVFRYRDKPVSSYELCCTASHIRAVQSAYEAGCDVAMICEDDIQLSPETHDEIATLLNNAPKGWAVLQLATLPESASAALADYGQSHQQLFAAKTISNPILCSEPALSGVTVHGANAYLISREGMANVLRHINSNEEIVVSCSTQDAPHNVELVADRLIYRLAAGARGGIWVTTLPIVTIEAKDSTIHPDHVASHQAVRHTAEALRQNAAPVGATLRRLAREPVRDGPPRVAISAFMGNTPLQFAQARIWVKSLRSVLDAGSADLFLHTAPDMPWGAADEFADNGVFVIPVPQALHGPEQHLDQLNCGALAGYDLTILTKLDCFFFATPVPLTLPARITRVSQPEDALWMIPGDACEMLRRNWSQRNVLSVDTLDSYPTVSIDTIESELDQVSPEEVALLRYGRNIGPNGQLLQAGIPRLAPFVERANRILRSL